MMRLHFEQQLELLNTKMIEMGAMCERAIDSAVTGLLEGNADLSREAVAKEKEIDDKEWEIENMCIKLLLQQQPVARDLRQISAAMKMITDMERIGDQAEDISEIALLGNIKVTDEVPYIVDMAAAAARMVTDSVDAYVRRDLELAQQVITNDDIVDDLFNKIKHELIDMISRTPSRSEYVVDLMMIAKYLERIGDHATNIAEWVEYSITGRHREDKKV